MLIGGAISEAQTATALETIERNARAQTRLIDDLLDVSRSVGGNLHLELREVRVAAVVEHAVDSMRPAAAVHGGSISADSGGDGHGATFRVRLPVAASQGTAAMAASG